MLKSTHNPKFASMSDADVTAAFLAAEVNRKKLIAQSDSGADIDSALDEIESLIFWLDDELCARDLPLPL